MHIYLINSSVWSVKRISISKFPKIAATFQLIERVVFHKNSEMITRDKFERINLSSYKFSGRLCNVYIVKPLLFMFVQFSK